MNITIVGFGNGGTALAADLVRKGHNITILKTSKLHHKHYEKVKSNNNIKIEYENGIVYSAYINHITENYDEALDGAELIVLFIQTNYHKDVIKKMTPYLRNGQILLLEPGYLSTCYFLNYCDKDLIIVEAESSPIDCRITEPGKVKVLFQNVRNPIGVYPNNKAKDTLKKLECLNYNFILTNNIVEAAFHNPKLIVHTVGAIFSIPRIEYSKGDYWMYREVFTPSIWNLVCALDKEKMDVLDKLGCKRIPYVEACKFRNSMDDAKDATDVFFDYAYSSSPKGPDIPDSRYITEDVPEGLVMLESLGEMLNVETPVCTGLINCASAALMRDFRAGGRTIERLGRKYCPKSFQMQNDNGLMYN